MLWRNERGTYRHNFSYTKKKCEDTENEKEKSQYKNSELNSAWEN